MKIKTIVVVVVAILFSCQDDTVSTAVGSVWIYKDGYHITDLIAFRDGDGYYRLDDSCSIFWNDSLVAVLVEANSNEIVIQSNSSKELGVYSRFQSLEDWNNTHK